ncbi:MAG: peroxiredoxin [Candidatus Thermoplasmatota archaeon]
MPKVGDAAPDFVLKDADGNEVRLSSYRGRPVVLYFYPKDRTPGCTIQAKSFRDEHAGLTEVGAVVLGVSLDSMESHCEFRDRHQLPFKLLSDPDGRIHDLYGIFWTSLFGKTSLAVRRTTFLIDAHGVIQLAHSGLNPVTHVTRALEELAALRS